MKLLFRINPVVRKNRDSVIKAIVETGERCIWEVAKELANSPYYAGLTMGGVALDVKRYFRQNGIAQVYKMSWRGQAPPLKRKKRARQLKNLKSHGSVVSVLAKPQQSGSLNQVQVADFDKLVNGVLLNLPLSSYLEVSKLVDVMRTEWHNLVKALRLEEEASKTYLAKLDDAERKAARLQILLNSFSAHKCPDVSQDVRDENTRLKDTVDKCAKRITFLETHGPIRPHVPLTGDQLVSPSGRG